MLRKPSPVWTLLVATIPLLGWWAYGLFDLDEGFYAAVVSEMNRRRDWVTPFYNGKPWFEKPILLYWLAKPSLLIFGEAIGPRLPSVLATIGVYSLLFWFARKRFDLSTATFATLILASCPLVVALGRMMMTDPLLMLCVSAAFLTLWESIEGDPRWRILSAIALGFGVLAKGPVAGILFLPPVGWMFLRHPSLRPRFRGGWVVGTLCFAMVVAAWYVPAYLANGQTFVQDFLIKQNLGRFSGGDQAHTVDGPVNLIFYPAIILICFLPWSLFLPTAWKHAKADPINSYLKAWFLTVLIFFTITRAKLPHYILPLSVPLALLIGQYFAIRMEKRPRPLAWPLGTIAVVTFLANIGFWGYYHGIKLGSLELPGFHAEVHQVARYVREHAAPGDAVVEYQMGRRQKDRGTMHIKIQETEQPSVLLYLNRNALQTDDLATVLAIPGKAWIITRWNRISDSELAAASPRLVRIPLKTPNDLFRLYLLNPATQHSDLVPLIHTATKPKRLH